VIASLWRTIADEAAAESSLWEAALLPVTEREEDAVFSPLGSERYGLAIESIYEGYLLHYGRPRLFRPEQPDTGVLLGDYLYAHGLVRLAAVGHVEAVADLAELISLCTQLRAEGDGAGGGRLDGAAWAATASLLGDGRGMLEDARAALRLERDPEPLEELAASVAGSGAVARALDVHAARVG
jgi:hypothetical protein